MTAETRLKALYQSGTQGRLQWLEDEPDSPRDPTHHSIVAGEDMKDVGVAIGRENAERLSVVGSTDTGDKLVAVLEAARKLRDEYAEATNVPWGMEMAWDALDFELAALDKHMEAIRDDAG